MATNCPQHVKPRACRSAYVRFTSAWNSVRGNRLRSWLNMLENRVTGEPPWWWRVEACRPRHHHTPRGLTRSQTLIWTRVRREVDIFSDLVILLLPEEICAYSTIDCTEDLPVTFAETTVFDCYFRLAPPLGLHDLCSLNHVKCDDW